MSNLIKSVYFNVDPAEARVIDSDQRVEEYIPNIYDRKNEVESFEFPQLDQEGAEEAAEFHDGLPVISYTDVVNEEREKLIHELLEQQEDTINAAKEQADQIIEEAKKEADSIRENAHMDGIREGREEGLAEAEEELVKMRQELQQEYDERFQELTAQEEKLEPAFAEIIVSLVKKLTGVVCEDKKDIILYLIGTSLKNLEKTSQIVIRVSKGDMALVSSKKSTLKMIAKDIDEFDIIEDDSLSENQCIIETDHKVIDCSLDAQLQNLEEHVKLLSF